MGAAAGSLVGGSFADALGRRASFMLCALPMLVGPLLSATATSLNPMVAGRFLAGVAIGLSSALVPLYISEVGTRRERHACACVRVHVMIARLCGAAGRPGGAR
jgi:MFS family permease